MQNIERVNRRGRVGDREGEDDKGEEGDILILDENKWLFLDNEWAATINPFQHFMRCGTSAGVPDVTGVTNHAWAG